MRTQFVCLLALIAYAAAGACPSDGYWHFHTRNTLKDPNFGPFDCLNAGLPCAEASTESAAKAAVKAAWTKAGGKSYKYMANGYCPTQVSQSNTWQTGKVTWKFSKLKRVRAERRLGACPSDGYWHFHTRNTLKDPNFGPFDCLNAGLPCGKASTESAAKAAVKAAWTKAGGKSYKYMANGYCPTQVSQSNTWQTGDVTWKFSKLKRVRRLGACPSDGYWHFHTRNTLKDPNFGPFDCLNAGLPCGKASTESAAKAAVKAAWTKAGGKSYKYMANGYCPTQVSQSNTWQTGDVTWKFSKLKRRLAAAKTQTVKIGNNGRSGEKCAKMPAGHYIRPVCTKKNGCRQNKDFANAGDAFAMKMKDGKVCATRTDAKGRGWGMQLAVKVGRIAAVRIGSSRSNTRCAKIADGFTCPEKCLKTEVDGLKCRANGDFAGANDAFKLTVKDGKVCAQRTDAKGGWGMNLSVNCFGN